MLGEVMHLNTISGFRREANENCALLVYYAASSDNFLPRYRDNVSVQSHMSRIQNNAVQSTKKRAN